MPRSSPLGRVLLPILSLTVAACGPEPPQTPEPPPVASVAATATAAAPPRYDQVPREEFNRLVAQLALPLFWASDGDGDGAIDGTEIAVLWGVATTARSHWVQGGTLTPAFAEAYRQVVARKTDGPSFAGLDAAEVERRKLVIRELDQGQPTLVRSRFAGASAADWLLVENILAAARLIERIHAKQLGSYDLLARLPLDDPASRMLFYRNQGPWCVAPATAIDARCSAVPGAPANLSGLYPPALQATEGFCDLLGQHGNAEQLRDPFHVVRAEGDELRAVPYHEEYGAEMKAIATKLRNAADLLGATEEPAFQKYLLAAAQAFEDNRWEVADEAWAAMHAGNSKWYLRIGPDEVYFEPCNLKAGFHVSFALIHPGSKTWHDRINPVKQAMEDALAKLAGPPYRSRDVAFRLADFIDVIVNAGESRNALGATTGQSLPNWGPVANERRGRTVAMANIFTDADSRRSRRAVAASVLCAAPMQLYEASREPMMLTVLLHEAAHNLGPAHEYEVKGKKDSDLFGGPLATTLEELKAQTAALYFTHWLRERGIVEDGLARAAHMDDVVWALAQLSQGTYTPTGRPRPYGQLSAIQVGHLLKHGALEWRPAELAANGRDRGCVAVHFDKLAPQVATLMGQVARLKATGDRAGAEALVAEHVDVEGATRHLYETIADRWRRAPKQTFVYAIER